MSKSLKKQVNSKVANQVNTINGLKVSTQIYNKVLRKVYIQVYGNVSSKVRDHQVKVDEAIYGKVKGDE